MTTITLTNPWTGESVDRDISDLTERQLDAYPLDEDVCAALHSRVAPCTPAEFLAAYVAAVGPEIAGSQILGS